MQLPPPLRAAVDDFLSRRSMADLRVSGERLTHRYRAETRDGRAHLNDEAAVAAYLAARLPATFAAISASLSSTAGSLPDFHPKTLLDIGAGPGTALWAAGGVFASLERATMIEASAVALDVGRSLAASVPDVACEWIEGEAGAILAASGASGDLVTLAYVLDELAPAAGRAVVDLAWRAAGEVLLIVEPGTPAGWSRILAARDDLVAKGAHILAPCPHSYACPIVAPDWCHFSQRVERTRLHRMAKHATVPYEDEKFAYLAVSRRAPAAFASRVLARPSKGKGKVQLKLCTASGGVEARLVTRREGDTFAAARRLDWGDRFG